MNNNEKINLRVTLKSIMFKSSSVTDVSNFNNRVTIWVDESFPPIIDLGTLLICFQLARSIPAIFG